jgi:hypothetical protein
MLHSEQLSEVARLRHKDDLKQAEAERLYNQIKANQPGLLQRVSHLLSAVRQRLETQAPSQPVQPAVRSITDQFKQVR